MGLEPHVFNSYLIIPSIMINLFWCLPHLEGFKANTTSITLSNFLSVFGAFEKLWTWISEFILVQKNKEQIKAATKPDALLLAYFMLQTFLIPEEYNASAIQ